MANLKAFKEVLDIAIKNDVVKVLTVLDQELEIHTKQNVINKINDLKANKIDNAQIELEFSEMPTRSLHEAIHHLYGTDFHTNISEDEDKFCAHI